MDVPKGFAKKQTKEEIEEIVKKTLVKEILVEDIAKEIKTYLESEKLAEKIEFYFNKTIDLTKNKHIKTVTERTLYPSKYNPTKIQDRIKVVDKEFSGKQRIQELNKIISSIKEIDPNITEADITYNDYYFSIISKDAVYKLSLSNDQVIESVQTDVTIPFTRVIKGKTLRIFERISEVDVNLPLVNIYHHPIIKGNIKYAKFNREHNQKMVEILKETGYDVYINIKDE